MSTPGAETMDRGVGTDEMRNILGSCDSMEIRHARRGWMQEFFCCISKSQFTYLNNKQVVAKSKEDFTFVCRCCFAPCHPFDMSIEDAKTETDFIEVNRPFRCCIGTGKCCCKQEATVFSGDEHLGDIKESCWWFVPSFKVYDQNETKLYVVKPPTCCFDGCVDCCPGGQNPCPLGHCRIPCNVYPVNNGVEGKDPVGRMDKIPKATFADTFNEINYFKVDFPDKATTDQKGLLLGSSILINAIYFENTE